VIGSPHSCPAGKLKERIRNELAHLRRRRLDSGFTREAAVLMPIFLREGEPHLLLTRRTKEVSTHKGQISFPGGMRQEGESLEETALRETFEEVGILQSRIEILGRFHDYVSITDCLVAPFAGYIDAGFATTPQQSEVAEVLAVPFTIFLDPSRLRMEPMLRSGETIDMYFYRYEPDQIWGLTARIIKDFFDELWKRC
jgi:8-oxo-dGTP pyrophosphatase MutT (NUDIX family)